MKLLYMLPLLQMVLSTPVPQATTPVATCFPSPDVRRLLTSDAEPVLNLMLQYSNTAYTGRWAFCYIFGEVTVFSEGVTTYQWTAAQEARDYIFDQCTDEDGTTGGGCGDGGVLGAVGVWGGLLGDEAVWKWNNGVTGRE